MTQSNYFQVIFQVHFCMVKVTLVVVYAFSRIIKALNCNCKLIFAQNLPGYGCKHFTIFIFFHLLIGGANYAQIHVACDYPQFCVDTHDQSI